MKKLLLTTSILLLSLSAFAQKRSDFKGPEYKNYKPWLHKTEPTKVYTISKENKLTGPEYKNQKPWENTSKKNYTVVTIGSERSKLRGPAYKNYKPWRKKDNK